MVDIFNVKKVNENLSEDGVWVTYQGDARLKVRYIDSSTAKNAKASYDKKILKLNKLYREKPPEEEVAKVLAEFVSNLLTDWENIDNNGVKVPFTQKNAVKALEVNHHLLLFIANISADAIIFEDDDIDDVDITEEEEKNS